jgi:mono/diheme cytochrome c family protein
MKRLWAVSALSLAILAGCSANAEEPLDAAGHYEKSCSACHGSDLKGGPSGPPVLNMKNKYTEEDLLKLMNGGKGMMPAKLLSEENAQLVAEWLLEK